MISWGLAGPLRRRAIQQLRRVDRGWVVDSGVGPGVSSRMLIEYGFDQIIGVDPSRILLRSAKTHLGSEFHPVVGVAENLPINSNCVGGIISCFSLRDVLDLDKAVSEFSRVVREQGRLEIVDIGKPDGPILPRLVGLYVNFAMPIIARVLIGRRARNNPFRMIIPTFQRLPTNQRLRRLVEAKFGGSTVKEFMLGGLIILEAERRGIGSASEISH